LYSVVIGQQNILTEWYEPFLHLPNPPPVTKSGITKAESLVHLVRDPVVRPDKVYTDKDGDPEWRPTEVDAGVSDKRRLIMQRLGPQLMSKRNVTARRLVDALNEAYDDGEVSVYVGYRDGGYHGTKSAHIGLLMSEPSERLAEALWEQTPVLLARAEGPTIYHERADRPDVLSDITAGIKNAPSQVTVAPEAARIIESEARSKRPYAVQTLLRVAHILAVLARSPVATEAMLHHALTIVEASESTSKQLCNSNPDSLGDQILEFVRASGGACARHRVVRRFRRRNTSAEISSQLAHLEIEQRLIPSEVKTAGRHREEWRLPQLS